MFRSALVLGILSLPLASLFAESLESVFCDEITYHDVDDSIISFHYIATFLLHSVLGFRKKVDIYLLFKRDSKGEFIPDKAAYLPKKVQSL